MTIVKTPAYDASQQLLQQGDLENQNSHVLYDTFPSNVRGRESGSWTKELISVVVFGAWIYVIWFVLPEYPPLA